jgi:TonB family protein
MKYPFTRSARLLALLALLTLSQLPGQSRPDDNAGISIDQVGVLVYPPKMLYNAIYTGEVRAVISVDEKGVLTDSLVTGYTTPEFAEAAVMALKRWVYHPARVNGRARSSRADVLFLFKDEGVIVQKLPGALEQHALAGFMQGRYIYQPCKLRELDRIPTPVQVVQPAIKTDGRLHSITVEFFIDEAGQVRMPAVARESADDVYAAAAVSAVEQWRFEPPLRKGRPVLVYAQQEFTFRPKE